MNYTISDLIDCLRDDSVDLAVKEIASTSRVKELTMRKIDVEKTPRRTGKALRAAILAAILAVLLPVVALAAPGRGNLFGGFFGDVSVSPDDATEGPYDAAETFEVAELPPAVTSGNITITPQAVHADRQILYVSFKVQSTDGSVLSLPDRDVGVYQVWGEESFDVLIDPDGRELHGGRPSLLPMWSDDVPGDDTLELALTFSGGKYTNRQITVKIPNIWIQDPYKEYTVAYKGPWEFTFTTPKATESIVLDVGDGISTTGYFGIDGAYETPVCLHHVAISNRYMVITYLFGSPRDAEGQIVPVQPYPLNGLGIVLKDGTTVQCYPDSAGGHSLEHASYGIYFTESVDFNDMDYFYFGGIVIPINQ